MEARGRSSEKRVWAKGVGTAFEFLNQQRRWEPIVDPFVINKLGKLCAYNETSVVTYDGRDNGQKYQTVQQADGMLAQTNIRTGVVRCIRLVPFFFEFEERPFDWRPVTEPQALMSLTAVLASSLPKRYKYKSATTHDEHEAEATLIGEKGLLQQRNVKTQKRRHIRPTPTGPDGEPHFEFLDDDGWKPVSEACVKQLAAVAVGRGEAFYDITHVAGKAAGKTFKYRATLGADGFITQTNTSTNAARQVRPAPWLGHGRSRHIAGAGLLDQLMGRGAPVRADPTNGYYPGREQMEAEGPIEIGVGVPIQVTVPIVEGIALGAPLGQSGETVVPTMQTMPMTTVAAEQFYVPEHVPMGSAENPVELQEVAPQGPVQGVYYYQPQVMEPGDPGHIPMAIPAMEPGNPGHIPMAIPV